MAATSRDCANLILALLGSAEALSAGEATEKVASAVLDKATVTNQVSKFLETTKAQTLVEVLALIIDSRRAGELSFTVYAINLFETRVPYVMVIIGPVVRRKDGVLEATNLMFFPHGNGESDHVSESDAPRKPSLVRSSMIHGTVIDVMAEFLGPVADGVK